MTKLWTAGKVCTAGAGVADQGTLIIYAPHIRELSRTWGEYIREDRIPHRDYFSRPDGPVQRCPAGVLAHLTHVRGTGPYEKALKKTSCQRCSGTSIPKPNLRSDQLGLYGSIKGFGCRITWTEKRKEFFLSIMQAKPSIVWSRPNDEIFPVRRLPASNRNREEALHDFARHAHLRLSLHLPVSEIAEDTKPFRTYARSG